MQLEGIHHLTAVSAEIKRHRAAHPEIHLTSAEKRRGIAALRATIAAFAV